MKKITIELNRKTTSETTELAIAQQLDRTFKVMDDTNERFEHLRFITIDGEDINIDLNGGVNIELRSISKPHICFAIALCFVYAVNVEF